MAEHTPKPGTVGFPQTYNEAPGPTNDLNPAVVDEFAPAAITPPVKPRTPRTAPIRPKRTAKKARAK
jgi:hypothetical protein